MALPNLGASFSGTPSKPSPSFGDIARSLLPPRNREKTFTQAITIAVSNFILIFILASLYGIYVVLLPFSRPLLLALLFGSFLFPLKRSLAQFFRRQITAIRNDEMPIIAGLTIPFKLVNNSINQLQNYCRQCVSVIISFGKTLLSGDLSSITAVGIAAMLLVITGGDKAMNILLCVNLIILITQLTKTEASFSDSSLQFLIRAFGLSQFYWLCPEIIYLLLPIIVSWLVLKIIIKKVKRHLLDAQLLSQVNNQQLENSQQQQSSTTKVTGTDVQETSEDSLSYTDDDSVVQVEFSFYEICLNIYKAFLDFMESYVDVASTICVILFVAFIIAFTTIYLSFQIYSETLYLVDRLSMTINSLVENNPDLKQILPEGITGMQGLLDGAVNNTYQHGREWIIRSTRQLINNAAMEEFNTTQSNLIEKQMVEFWDRAYVMWLKNRNGTIPSNDNGMNSSPYDWNRLFDALKTLNFTLCAEIFKQNWETLVSISDSLSRVLKGNINLVIGMITALFSFFVVGGNALVNFIINLFIFITALFNLLCASGAKYKPIELIKSWTPPAMMKNWAFKSQHPKSQAVESIKKGEIWSYFDESINAVFTALLKIMAFQGLSTWLIHRQFQIQVVYIPSVISMILGAVPFISPYWASVPAALDLCLSEHWTQGLLMFLFATVPSSFVISKFYSEIKGAGDSYLTGLAIAGGVFVFGIDGALFGPIALVSMQFFYQIIVYHTDIYDKYA